MRKIMIILAFLWVAMLNAQVPNIPWTCEAGEPVNEPRGWEKSFWRQSRAINE